MKLRISGMTCQHCVRSVTEALAAVDGVSEVINVDLDTGLAEVIGTPDPAALLEAVKEEGYEAEIA